MSPRFLSRSMSRLSLLLALGSLSACQSLPGWMGGRARPPNATAPQALPSTPAAATPAKAEWREGMLQRPRARWVPAAWGELPGWGSDRVSEVLPALRRSCQRPAEGWATLCSQLKRFEPSDEVHARRWLEDRLRVFRVESLDGQPDGLLTGYYEPMMLASRQATAQRRVPLWAPPADLGQRKPYWSRQELDTLPPAQEAVRGRELAWLEDPLDALVLQIQGSGRLRLQEADGSERWVRLAYAGHNDQPYRSVGRWLIDQGELKPARRPRPA